MLLQDRLVFACHRDRWDTIYYSELGSSLAILNAGYNIDSFMLRYQGVDWRNKSTWDCNERWVCLCLCVHVVGVDTAGFRTRAPLALDTCWGVGAGGGCSGVDASDMPRKSRLLSFNSSLPQAL